MAAMMVVVAALFGCVDLGEVPPPRQPQPAAALISRVRFTVAERRQLDRRESVTREQVFFFGKSKYIGAVSWLVVNAEPDQVLGAMLDVQSAGEWLPFNHRAAVVEGEGGHLMVELLQGVEPFLASFYVRIDRDGDVVRIELARERPHDIRDLWAFITARPYGPGSSLITQGIAVDLGDGALRLIEKEVQGTFHWIIDDIGSYVERVRHAHPPPQICHAQASLRPRWTPARGRPLQARAIRASARAAR